MNYFYDSNGYLDAVNNDIGKTIAVLIDSDGGRILHPEYDTDEAKAAIANVLLFDPKKVAPPVIEPEPEE